MFNDSVDQNPIIAVNDGTNTGQNSPTDENCDGFVNSGPTPPARRHTHPSSAAASTSTIGAAQFSKTRIAFMPR